MFMDRLEWVRTYVDQKIEAIQDVTIRALAYVHTYGVVQNCALLAIKRNGDIELCSIAGMLHDISQYAENHPHKDHAKRSSEITREILTESKLFTKDEIIIICHAIEEHSNKMKREDGKITEILKDADSLAHYLYNTNIELSPQDKYRLFYVLEELKDHS